MVTGIISYKYRKRQHYARFKQDGEPELLGDWFAAQIPRDEAKRAAWLQELEEKIKKETAWRANCGIADFKRIGLSSTRDLENQLSFQLTFNGQHPLFQAIQKEPSIHPDMCSRDWSYVIDLDGQQFTINGLMHYQLQNMPPNSLASYFWRIYTPGTNGQKTSIPTFAHLPSTPIEHIALYHRRVSDPTYYQVDPEYEKMAPAPVAMPASDWGAPDWTTLSLAQRLSADLVQTILLDSAEKLQNQSFSRMRPAVGLISWQLLTAAAPGLVELALDCTRQESDILSLSQLESNPELNSMTPYYQMNNWYGVRRYYWQNVWFRGCLVTFTMMIDESAGAQTEMVRVTSYLRSLGGDTPLIAILFSPRHLLAIAVDGAATYCSPLLPFHDEKMQMQDGFLLATHLLSPHLSVNKTKFLSARTAPTKPRVENRYRLPTEILCMIMFSLDHHSYRKMRLVSRKFRDKYYKYPRIGDDVLLGYTVDGNYCSRNAKSGLTSIRHLQRVGEYDRKHRFLAGSFVHVHPGPHNLVHNVADKTSWLRYGNRDVTVSLSTAPLEFGDQWIMPWRYLQVVQGVWELVHPDEARSNCPTPVEYDKGRDAGADTETWSAHHWGPII